MCKVVSQDTDGTRNTEHGRTIGNSQSGRFTDPLPDNNLNLPRGVGPPVLVSSDPIASTTAHVFVPADLFKIDITIKDT